MHLTLNRCTPAFSRSKLSSRLSAINGKKAFSSNSPREAAIVIASSLAMTRIATSMIISGMTGLILPGIMEEPCCRGCRWISLRPPFGPLDIRRISPAIFSRLTAKAFSRPDTSTKTSLFWVGSIRSSGSSKCRPVISFSFCTASTRYSLVELLPKPTAVPPRLILLKRSSLTFMRP